MPANEPDQPESNPLEAQTTDLQDEPAGSPILEPDQPVATLNEPTCPNCGEILEPDPVSGLAACIGCGRLFRVEIPPETPDDDGDGNPPDPNNNPPNPQDNGHGRSKTEFTPPLESPAKPTRFYSDKFWSPAIFNRMTERQPDGSVKLVWQDKTETVAPDDLACWQPIEEIPEINLPSIESVEIPPTVVLDIETTDSDPEKGRILAVGLALFVAGKEEETQIIRNEGDEAALLAQVFDWLRETCDGLGEIILTGYNMFDFDLTFLIESALRLEMERACPFDYEKDEDGKIKRLSIPDTNGKYTYTAIKTNLPIMLIDTQHLVIRWDEFEKALVDYRLKSVAVHFGVNIHDRPILSTDEIQHAFLHDPTTFNAYLLADLRETYALFDILIKPYAGIAALTGLGLEDLARLHGKGWIWQQILQRHYTEIPEADEWRDYVGGLVVSRKGLWFNCAKFDIASLYPTIMLAYRIHSRKDPAQIALRWLKTLTQQRLALKEKAKAKEKDTNAQILQEAMKVLINSLYGFYGCPYKSYKFNDIDAAEKVTKIGRKILTCMIAAIEDKGGIVVEADTDGIIVCCQDKDPQEILQAISVAIPPVFKVELEWQGMTVFVSEDKHYIVYDSNNDLVLVKGGKWRGRDKPAYQREAIPTFLQIWLKQGKEAALEYAERVLSEIRSGKGWRWVVCTRRVSVNDKSLQRRGFKVGDKATFAYKRKTNKSETTEIALSPNEGYDRNYYAKQFSDLVEEVIAAIDPALVDRWREIVSQEARQPILTDPLRP
jgi:DNA polymerase elongation subunit (family B)